MNSVHTLSVQDHEEDLVNMKQLDSKTARETLGVMQALSGEKEPEVKFLLEKVKSGHAKIKHSSLQNQDVTKAVNMTIMRSLRYGLVATAITYKQCDEITKELLKGVLPKMGIIRTANTTLATSPRNMQGVVHLYILQLVDHLKVICNHSGDTTDTGTLLRNKLEAITIQAGKGGSPLNFNPGEIKWIEHSWWTNTLIACNDYNIRIKGKTNQLSTWTTNDSFLMDDFSQSYPPESFSAFLCSINRVRLYFQVATRSDIQLACGWRCNTKIFQDTMVDLKFPSKRAYNWPEQGRPTKNDFKNWTIAIEEVYGLTNINHTFRQEH